MAIKLPAMWMLLSLVPLLAMTAAQKMNHWTDAKHVVHGSTRNLRAASAANVSRTAMSESECATMCSRDSPTSACTSQGRCVCSHATEMLNIRGLCPTRSRAEWAECETACQPCYPYAVCLWGDCLCSAGARSWSTLKVENCEPAPPSSAETNPAQPGAQPLPPPPSMPQTDPSQPDASTTAPTSGATGGCWGYCWGIWLVQVM